MSFPSPLLTPPTLRHPEFAYRGVTFGAMVGPFGPSPSPYHLISATGLGMAAVRSGDSGRPRDHGENIGLDLLGGRDITVELGVVPWAVTSTWDVRQALQNACAMSVTAEVPLWYQPAESNAPKLACMARVRKFEWPLDTLALTGMMPGKASVAAQGGAGTNLVTVLFHATDPRWYSAPSAATAIGPGQTVGLTNAGTFEMRPILIFNGPSSLNTVTNVTEGAAMTFSDPDSPALDLAAGDVLTVDLDSHAITKYTAATGGIDPANNWTTNALSTWWSLAPGTNQIHYTCTNQGVGTGLTVWWASAWLGA